MPCNGPYHRDASLSDVGSSERFGRYHFRLLAILGIATLYEGFDASMLTLASVDVRATLNIGLDEWGTLYAITRAGMVASFFFLMCADRFGRRKNDFRGRCGPRLLP